MFRIVKSFDTHVVAVGLDADRDIFLVTGVKVYKNNGFGYGEEIWERN